MYQDKSLQRMGVTTQLNKNTLDCYSSLNNFEIKRLEAKTVLTLDIILCLLTSAHKSVFGLENSYFQVDAFSEGL